MGSRILKQEITEALQSFGLSDKETRAYTALLGLGSGSAYAVARAANLKLSTSYVVLDSLIAKGVVVRVPRTRKRLYTARQPYVLLELLEERTQLFKRAMPLLAGVTRDHAETQMLFFEGTMGIKQGLSYRLNELGGKEIVAFYGAAQKVTPELNEVFLNWNTELASRDITTRAIVPDHPSLVQYRKLDKAHNRVVKIVPYEQYTADMSIDATPQFVRLQVFGAVPQCVIIESAAVAKTFRQIFEMLWLYLPTKSHKRV